MNNYTYIRWLFSGAFLFLANAHIAQDISPTEVKVIEGFNPEVQLSTKIREMAEFIDTSRIDKSQEYYFIDKFIKADYQITSIKPAKVKGESLDDWNKKNISLGFGSHATSEANVNINLRLDNSHYYSAELYHFNNNFKSKYQDGSGEKKAGWTNNSVSFFGKQIASKNIFLARLDYSRNLYYTYGHEFLIGEKYCKNRFDYTKLESQIISKDFNLLDLNHRTQFFISDFNNRSENQIHFSSQISKQLYGYPMSVDVAFDNYISSYDLDNDGSSKNQDMQQISCEPLVLINKYGLDFNLGFLLDLAIDVDNSSSFLFFPKIHVSNHLVPGVLNLEGGLHHYDQKHTLRSFSLENPYIHSLGSNQKLSGNDQYMLDIQVTDNTELYFSMSNQIGRNEVFDLNVYCNWISSLPSFIDVYEDQYNRFLVDYVDVTQFRVSSSYDWQVNDLVGFKIDANYYYWGDVILSHREKINAKLLTSFNLRDKIMISPSITYLGERDVKTTDLSYVLEDQISILSPVTQINLSFEYYYTESLGAFIRFNNILDEINPLWKDYNRIGFHGIFGVAYSF